MKYFFFVLNILVISILSVKAQSNEIDSIFAQFNLKYSPEALKKAKLEYEQANDTIRSIMAQVYSMPMSSRAELIENYEKRTAEINNLKDEFNRSVPKGYYINLEITMDDGPLKYINSIDMQIFKKNKNNKLDLIAAEWDIKYPSPQLDSLLDIVKWDPMTFSDIKNLLQISNCISIQNTDKYTEIGFARSGLGKYSYLIFKSNLNTLNEIKSYNDGCEYMYYKPNIVMRYTGGMAGSQCFTD